MGSFSRALLSGKGLGLSSTASQMEAKVVSHYVLKNCWMQQHSQWHSVSGCIWNRRVYCEGHQGLYQ